LLESLPLIRSKRSNNLIIRDVVFNDLGQQHLDPGNQQIEVASNGMTIQIAVYDES